MWNPFIGPRERIRREAAAWFARMQGTPDTEDRQAFERWRRADPEHDDAYARMSVLYRGAGALGQMPSGQVRTIARRPARHPPVWSYAAAAVVLVLFAVPVLFTVGGLPLSPAGAETLRFATRLGEVRDIGLEDGSRVTLDAASRLEVALRDQSRTLKLVEGRMRVRPRIAEPHALVVEAGPGRITSRGGIFDVALVGDEVRVTPLDGAVVIAQLDPKVSSQVLTLTPGQEGAVTGRTLQQREPTGGTSWPDGVLVFDHAELAAVVEEANRYGPQRIRLGEPALGRLRVNGRFRAGDTGALARTIAAAFGLRVVQSRAALTLHAAVPAAGAEKNGG